MKFLISFKKNESKMQGRSVTARMGHEPAPKLAIEAVEVKGYCFMFKKTLPEGSFYFRAGGKEFQTQDEAQSFVDEIYNKEAEWFNSAEKVSIDIETVTAVESEGSTYGFDAWVNEYLDVNFVGWDAAIAQVHEHYGPELYKKGFKAVFEHGKYSINEMIGKGWIIPEMKTIEQKINEDIRYENVDALDVVEYGKVTKNMELDGYEYKEGDIFVSDQYGSCVYRPDNDNDD
jgi:hypothetical protein